MRCLRAVRDVAPQMSQMHHDRKQTLLPYAARNKNPFFIEENSSRKMVDFS